MQNLENLMQNSANLMQNLENLLKNSKLGSYLKVYGIRRKLGATILLIPQISRRDLAAY